MIRSSNTLLARERAREIHCRKWPRGANKTRLLRYVRYVTGRRFRIYTSVIRYVAMLSIKNKYAVLLHENTFTFHLLFIFDFYNRYTYYRTNKKLRIQHEGNYKFTLVRRAACKLLEHINITQSM